MLHMATISVKCHSDSSHAHRINLLTVVTLDIQTLTPTPYCISGDQLTVNVNSETSLCHQLTALYWPPQTSKHNNARICNRNTNQNAFKYRVHTLNQPMALSQYDVHGVSIAHDDVLYQLQTVITESQTKLYTAQPKCIIPSTRISRHWGMKLASTNTRTCITTKTDSSHL